MTAQLAITTDDLLNVAQIHNRRSVEDAIHYLEIRIEQERHRGNFAYVPALELERSVLRDELATRRTAGAR